MTPKQAQNILDKGTMRGRNITGRQKAILIKKVNNRQISKRKRTKQ